MVVEKNMSQNFIIANIWSCASGKMGVDCWNGFYLMRFSTLHLLKNGKEISISGKDYDTHSGIWNFTFDMVDLDYYPGVWP